MATGDRGICPGNENMVRRTELEKKAQTLMVGFTFVDSKTTRLTVNPLLGRVLGEEEEGFLVELVHVDDGIAVGIRLAPKEIRIRSMKDFVEIEKRGTRLMSALFRANGIKCKVFQQTLK